MRMILLDDDDDDCNYEGIVFINPLLSFFLEGANHVRVNFGYKLS